MKENIDHLPTSGKLERLSDLVEKNQALDMERWLSSDYGHELTPEDLFLVSTQSCRTSACAFGTAAVCFEGLEMVYGISVPDVLEVRCTRTGTNGFEAAEDFFGIGVGESLELFSFGAYPELWTGNGNKRIPIPGCDIKGAVVSRIRALAANYRARGL